LDFDSTMRRLIAARIGVKVTGVRPGFSTYLPSSM
jgi:hypothetical protein